MYRTFIGCSTEGRIIAEAVCKIASENPFLETIPWWRPGVFSASDFVLESLLQSLIDIDYAILIASPDDDVTKRGRRKKVPRDNILLEYGLLASQLGRKNVLIVRTGDVSLPSDLDGVLTCSISSPPQKRFWLRSSSCSSKDLASLRRSLNDLIAVDNDGCISALAELRRLGTDSSLVDLTKALAIGVRKRMDRIIFAEPPWEEISSIIHQHTKKQNRAVGLEGKETFVDSFIDFSNLSDPEMSVLCEAYGRFIARHLSDSDHDEQCATRVAVEHKDDATKSKFLAATLRQLGVRPAIVDPRQSPLNSTITGRALNGERCVFVHDFTVSGYRPQRCIAGLTRLDIRIKKLITFLCRETDFPILEKNCAEKGLTLVAFSILNDDGTVSEGVR